MKSLVIYSSHYGNTAFVASRFQEALKKLGEADIFELVKSSELAIPPIETKNRVQAQRVDLEHAPADFKDYDAVFIGIPLWAKLPRQPLASYLNRCTNLDARTIIFCLIYGKDENKKESFEYLKGIWEGKGKPNLIFTAVEWDEVHNEGVLNNIIQKAINKIRPVPNRVSQS